ncbi:MAG: putative metal-binding motif-containing protein [Planctomycetes bacterium]|nr:putative metal-binding motif-containing protein [Planctomycetota bacterium]
MSRLASLPLLCQLVAMPCSLATAQSPEWTRQIGTGEYDEALASAPDGSSGVYFGGHTSGALGGGNVGLADAWISRYNRFGTQVWIRQFGTTANDWLYAAAPDTSGGVFVGGGSRGNLGALNQGHSDAWLARYDSAGSQAWVRQLGTSGIDFIYAAASDGLGGVFVGGETAGSLAAQNAGGKDAWFAHYDHDGDQTWIRQLGATADDAVHAMALDGAGGVFVGGAGPGLAGPIWGGWVARFDSAGNQSWMRQIAASEIPSASSDGSGGVFVGGRVGSQGVLARFDVAGNQLWTRSFPATLYAVAADGIGGVIAGGSTTGSVAGPNAGLDDTLLARYDSVGGQTWIRQSGSALHDFLYTATADGSGGVFAAGRTYGNLGGVNVGQYDAWFSRTGYFERYLDADSDGFGSGPAFYHLVPSTPGFSPFGADCDDGNAVVYPGAPEICDGLDNDCNGVADDSFTSNYCTAGTSVQACVPSIGGQGVPSSSAASGFTINVSMVPGQRYGLIFYGSAPTAQIWAPGSSSYFCIFYPISRTGVLDSGGTVGSCDGVLALDWNVWRAANPLGHGSPFSAGQVFYAQGWYRDPGAAKQTNLSDGLRFTLCN